MKTLTEKPKSKPNLIEFYCKACRKLGRFENFLMPIRNMNGDGHIGVGCMYCLHDEGYRFKDFKIVEENDT